MSGGWDDRFDAEAVIDALAPLLELPVTAEYRPGIVANLRMTARLAALVAEFQLDDREEPASVYEA